MKSFIFFIFVGFTLFCEKSHASELKYISEDDKIEGKKQSFNFQIDKSIP